MIPRMTSGGRSFRGAWQYYMHDPKEKTRDRIAWAHTENMLTDDPDKAWKVMAFTAMNQERLKEASGQSKAGRKLEKPVMAYSLAWHPDQNPDKDHMLDMARRSLDVLGMGDHEAIIVAHRDTDHPHVHILANRVHPLTGKVASNSHSHRKLSEFARQYEQEQGLTYCPQREENHQKREDGEKTRYRDPVIEQAWAQSDNGKGFVQALEEHGYRLAQGRKRIVVVDPHGKAINPLRHMEGVKTRQFRQRLSDLDLDNLPTPEELEQQAVKKPEVQAEQEAAPPPKPIETAWANQMRAELQDRLISQRHKQEERHLAEKRSLVERLHEFYQLKAHEQEIARLRERTAKPSWWAKLIGRARRERQALHGLELTHANAQMRIGEQKQSLSQRQAGERKRLNERQAAEKRELERRISLHATSVEQSRSRDERSQMRSERSRGDDYDLSR